MADTPQWPRTADGYPAMVLARTTVDVNLHELAECVGGVNSASLLALRILTESGQLDLDMVRREVQKVYDGTERLWTFVKLMCEIDAMTQRYAPLAAEQRRFVGPSGVARG